MTPDDLPCSAGYRWMQWAGEWWCVPVNEPTAKYVAVFVSRRLLVRHGPELATPSDVRKYYHARPHVPCPFVFGEP